MLTMLKKMFLTDKEKYVKMVDKNPGGFRGLI